MKLRLKAILLLTLLLASDVVTAPCAIEESNVDWDNLKQCVGNYPAKFLTQIDKMSKAHKEIKRGTEFFVEGVQSMLKDLSIKLTTVRFLPQLIPNRSIETDSA